MLHLKWTDENFWDSSPRFLFKQLHLFGKSLEARENKNGTLVNKNNGYEVYERREGNKIITTEKKKLGVIK